MMGATLTLLTDYNAVGAGKTRHKDRKDHHLVRPILSKLSTLHLSRLTEEHCMLDRWALPLIQKPLNQIADVCQQRDIHANQVTVTGFVLGLLVVPSLYVGWYWLALILILMNRVFDGVDGVLARQTGATDQGAFLDITLDFIFYAAVVFGFALANPADNALAASALLLSFMGTGVSFLAFAIMAERRNLSRIQYPNKGIYYLSGLAEGTETIAFFVAFCLWPQHFAVLAWSFAGMCVLSATLRIWSGYHSLSGQADD
jgi:phosphatidylglycerophosphate synthase